MKFFLKMALASVFFAATFFGLAEDAHALFTLSASPRRGGQGIHFEAAPPGTYARNEEVTLSVDSTIGTTYQISQIVYQPLTNEFGNTIPQGAFIAFSPSNPLGRLRTQLETPVTMGQVPIYTSNSAGDSDSFVLAFNVNIPKNQPGGIYHTTITFTAELVNPAGGASPSTVNLDVRLDVRPDFRVEIRNSQGSKDLNFGKISKDKPSTAESLSIAVQSNIGATYRIIQQMTQPLLSEDGVELEDGSITFSVAGGANGTLKASGELPLAEASVPIYASNDKGAEDALDIQYVLSPTAKQKAGIYSGTLSFKVESSSSFFPDQVFNIPLRIEIEPLFYLDVEIEQGSGLHFGLYKTGEESQEKKVTVTVHSNLGEPYQVSQIVSRSLTNQEGSVIPKEHFTFYGSDAQTGVLAVMSPKTVEDGEFAVFTSNNAGTPEKFFLNYTLTMPRDAKSGTYNSDIKYSITTL